MPRAGGSRVSSEQQRQLIAQLQVTYSKGTDLVMELILAGETEPAEAARKKTRALEKRIDGLLARLLDRWSLDVKAAVEDGRARNRKLQAVIRDIQNDVDRANKVIKALGHLDEAAATAKSILAHGGGGGH